MPPFEPFEPRGALAPADYVFTCPDGPAARWHVRRFSLREALSETYALELELSTDEPDIALEELLGRACTLALLREGQGRRVHAIVRRVETLDPVAGRTRVRVLAVPALELLGCRRNTRFWQDRSAPQILTEVLEGPLAEHGRSLELSLDEGAYKVREYCVQYRESDLEFAARLMREEGIVYAFEHEGEAERLVLLGTTVNAKDLEIPPISFVARGSGAAFKQSIDGLDWARELGVTQVVQRDWDWQDATPTRREHERRATQIRGPERERYDHDERRLHADDGALRARHKLEAEAAAELEVRGSSDVVELVPGRCFAVLYHPDLERQGRYLVLAVTHRGEAPEDGVHDASMGEQPRYRNEFRCARPEAPQRSPQPPARPRVHGPHTAIVVGPPGEEIHTDEHGRIKVQFHWDRRSPADDSASCWLRVAQAWAGLGWGAQFLPRVGMEVLVEFIDGDPDRPVVTGCVYNGLQRPPYALPDCKTQSGLKSDSSPGGGGSNELRFEDAKDREEVYLHAQRDLREEVGHAHATTVGENQSNAVGGDHSETVGGKQTLSVEKSRKVTIKGSQSVEIKGEAAEDGVRGGKLDITGDYKVDASSTVAIQAPAKISLTCGGSSLTLEPGKITLTAGGAATLVLDANALLKSAAGAKLLLDANALAQASGGAKVLLDANALAQASGGAKVLLDANALAQSSGGAKLLLDGNALMSAPGTATVQAPTSTLAGGGGSVQASGAGVTCAGGQVNVSGGMVNVSGGVVKIN